MGSAPDDMQELKERAEEGARDGQLAGVSFTMALLAVLLAITSMLGHRSHGEGLQLQTKVTDQWSYYQAKNMRRNTDQVFLDSMTVFPVKDEKAAAQKREQYEKEIERYKDDQKDIDAEARKLEQEIITVHHRANRFDLGEIFLAVGLVVTSITLLTRKRSYWILGMGLGVVGVLSAISAVFVH